jgi:hypothetical protein
MKSFQAAIVVAGLLAAAPCFAKVEQCRFIGSKPDREACYDRQTKALEARKLEAKKAEAAAKPKPADSLGQRSPEDQELARQLRSICRGC